MERDEQKLRRELKHLQEEIKQLKRQLQEKPDYRLGPADPGIYEWEMALARLRRLESRAASVKAALQKLIEGTYGICELCGGEIEPERLEILPHTTLCSACAAQKLKRRWGRRR